MIVSRQSAAAQCFCAVSMNYCRQFTRVLSRREMLRASAAGFGSLALASLLSDESCAAELPGTPHFAPRAKQVIFLFMHGGPSQVDTFDYKPQLTRDHGKPLPFPKPRVVYAATGGDRQLAEVALEFRAAWPVWQLGQRAVSARCGLRR